MTGFVTGQASGLPLEGAVVRTVPPTSSTITDSTGYFIIEEVKQGIYEIISTKSSYQPDTVRGLQVNNNATTNCEISLKFQDPKNGLVAFYRFSGDANDESGHGIHGTVTGGPIAGSDRFGKQGQAFSFDGINDYVDVPDSRYLDVTSGLSVCAWIKPNDFPSDVNILNKWSDDGAGDRGFVLGMHGTSVYFAVIDNANVFDTGQMPINTSWHFLVGTWDGLYLRIFLDGEQVFAHVTVGGFTNQRTNLTIGNGFFGSIDDVRIYDRALSANQIRSLYGER
jgi:hypothetical protein